MDVADTVFIVYFVTLLPNWRAVLLQYSIWMRRLQFYSNEPFRRWDPPEGKLAKIYHEAMLLYAAAVYYSLHRWVNAVWNLSLAPR